MSVEIKFSNGLRTDFLRTSSTCIQPCVTEPRAPKCSIFTVDHFSDSPGSARDAKTTLLNISLQVSAFSTWEKELHKIVFDPRYLLLNSEERKQVCCGRPGDRLETQPSSDASWGPGGWTDGHLASSCARGAGMA